MADLAAFQAVEGSYNDAVIDAEAIDIRLGAGQTAEDRISEINDKTGRVSERV